MTSAINKIEAALKHSRSQGFDEGIEHAIGIVEKLFIPLPTSGASELQNMIINNLLEKLKLLNVQEQEDLK